MVPQSLAAFDRAKIPDQAVLAATHSSESAIPEALHGAKMHRELIPSILDRVIRAGTRQIEGRDERGGCSSHAVGEVSSRSTGNVLRNDSMPGSPLRSSSL